MSAVSVCNADVLGYTSACMVAPIYSATKLRLNEKTVAELHRVTVVHCTVYIGELARGPRNLCLYYGVHH